MRTIKLAAITAVLILLTVAPVRADVLVTFHDGKEIRTPSLTYDGFDIKLADGATHPRGAVKRIALIHDEEKTTDAAAAASEDVAELLKTAEEAIKRFPNAKCILLVDHGYEQKRADGTLIYRYRTTEKILHPDMLALATRGLYFEEEREKARIIQARSIDPDGTVHNYDPAAVKISEPSRDAVSFGRGKRMTYQIPEVKVGSIVDYTHEWEIFNPYDPEMFFPTWNFAGTQPFIHSKLEIVVPQGQELYYSARHMPEEVKKPQLIRGRETTTYVWEMRNQPGVVEEPFMPPVSDVVARLECSPFKDWTHIKNWASERLLPRMKPDESLKKLVADLTKNEKDVDGKIAALYHHIQRNINYISIKGSIASGMCGHPASETLANKYGDCIDVAILLSALLRIAGLNAYPVWVNTNDSPSIPTDIPTLGGNHAIVEVRLEDETFYLDPTATNYRYPAFRWDDHGVRAINPILAQINPVPVPDASETMIDTRFDVTLSPEGDASVKFLSLRTGSWESGARGYFIRANDEEIEKTMRSIVNSYSPGGELEGKPEIINVKDLSKQLEWHMGFKLPAYATKAGDLLVFKILGLNYSFPEVALEKRKYDIDYKSSEETRHKVTLNVPEGYRVKYMPPEIEFSSEYATYKASCTEEDGKITFEDRYRQLTRYVPVKDYEAHRAILQKIARYSKEHIFFEKIK